MATFFRWFVLWSCFTSTQPTDKSCRLSPCADCVCEAHLCLFVATLQVPRHMPTPPPSRVTALSPEIHRRYALQWPSILRKMVNSSCNYTLFKGVSNVKQHTYRSSTNAQPHMLKCVRLVQPFLFLSRCSRQTTKVGQLMSVLWRHFVAFGTCVCMYLHFNFQYECMYLRFNFWIIWTIFNNPFERNANRVHSNAVHFFLNFLQLVLLACVTL
jgi:hypothetical protein